MRSTNIMLPYSPSVVTDFVDWDMYVKAVSELLKTLQVFTEFTQVCHIIWYNGIWYTVQWYMVWYIGLQWHMVHSTMLCHFW